MTIKSSPADIYINVSLFPDVASLLAGRESVDTDLSQLNDFKYNVFVKDDRPVLSVLGSFSREELVPVFTALRRYNKNAYFMVYANKKSLEDEK